MYFDDYTMKAAGAQIHSKYIADSDAYRTMQRAKRSAAATASQTVVPQNVLERLGAVLISLGRRLCERRGSMHVEVQFQAQTAHPGADGRHVA
jgi:hypothetical protein